MNKFTDGAHLKAAALLLLTALVIVIAERLEPLRNFVQGGMW